MNILLPENIFTSIIALSLPEDLRHSLQFHPASAISAILEKEEGSAALIPALDIISHRDLYISAKYGISFEGSLCNSYIYFSENSSLNSLNLAGDVTSSEVILSRILFKELYNLEVEVGLTTSTDRAVGNLIIAGKQNFYNDKLFDGISFSEEMIELLSLPYVSFVLASADGKLVKELEPVLLQGIASVYDNFENLEQYFYLTEKTSKYVKQNISSLILELNDHDIEAINQLIMLPYFHGIIKEIVEPKFA